MLLRCLDTGAYLAATADGSTVAVDYVDDDALWRRKGGLLVSAVHAVTLRCVPTQGEHNRLLTAEPVTALVDAGGGVLRCAPQRWPVPPGVRLDLSYIKARMDDEHAPAAPAIAELRVGSAGTEAAAPGAFAIERGPPRLLSVLAAQLHQDGYLVLPELYDPRLVATCARAIDDASRHLSRLRPTVAGSAATNDVGVRVEGVLHEHGCVGRLGLNPIVLALVRGYLRTPLVRLAHSPHPNVLWSQDGELGPGGGCESPPPPRAVASCPLPRARTRPRLCRA